MSNVNAVAVDWAQFPPRSRRPICIPNEGVIDAGVDFGLVCELLDAGAAQTTLDATENATSKQPDVMSRVPGKSPRIPGIGDHRRPPRISRPRTTEATTSRMEPSTRSRADGISSGLTVSSEESDPESLLRQNYALRHRLEEESATYKRRIDAYRQAQQNQATLVSRLQAKVLQYKQRCAELESQMVESVGAVGSPVKHRPRVDVPPDSAYAQAQKHLQELREERIQDLDTALHRLDEERKKCEKLMQLNSILKEQLEESHQTNEALTNDLQKLTNDWEQMREEMIIKEDEWKDEEQAFNDYYSNEHSRLLGLWRNVVSVKRMFSDMQSTNERDLFKLRSELTNIGRDVTNACGRIGDSVPRTDSFGFKQLAQSEKEASELRQQIHNITAKYDALQMEVNMKEDRIQQLLHEIQNLEERCGDAEQGMGQLVRMQEEVDVLHSALRDIAHAVIQDAETLDIEAIQRASHIHLTPAPSIPQKSPKRGAAPSLVSPAFAESTISAVHAALHKYQSLIHELQVKLQSNREQLVLVRRQCENADEANTVLESRIAELVPQLDACKTHSAQLTQEKDLLQKSLDAMRAEKNSLERNRVELNSLIESLNSDNEKLQKANTKLQKLTDSLTDEKLFLQTEVDRMIQDANIREINLRTEEERCSRLHEELLTAREELNKMYLSQDMLEQQKMETDGLIAALERTKGDVKLELERTLSEQMNSQDSMVKLETMIANLDQEKKKLQADLKKTEEEKQALQSQCTDQQNDIASLRKELLHAEQTRLDLESDKVTLGEKNKFLEIEKEKLEVELNQVSRERSDLSNQLSQLARKKEVLNEELMRLRQRLEQANENNARINRNLEDLVKETEEKQVLLETNSKELQRLQEQLASMHSEKEALEAVLFDTQTNLEASDNRRNQLEKEQQELLVKQEALKGTVARLTKELEISEKRAQDIKTSLTQQSGSMEVEFQQTVANLKKHNEETSRKLLEEKELVRTTLEKQMQQTLHQLTNEKDSEIQQLQDRIESLQQHIENVCEQHEELLLRAENDKQQALLIAHHDQQALQERYASLRHDLETERDTLERLRRETSTRIDQDRIMINQLKDELARLRTKLEELRSRAEDERNALELRIAETQKERDHAQLEAQETKVQLHLYEDRIDDLNNQLQDTQRKLKEIENVSEGLRKDLTDVRRQLADSNFEKDKYMNSNKELRDHVKRTESEKREVSRELEEAFQKIASMEEVKVTLENERGRLQTQLRDAERDQMQGDNQLQSLQQELQSLQAANIRHQAEEKELMARLSNESDERERLQQQLHQQQKKMAELEGSLNMTRQDLGRLRAHGAEEEERWHAREQELLVRLEDSRNKEKKLEDQKHNLEVCLTDATQQIQELKARLGGAEGRVRGLDAQLSQLEGSKRDIEQKLSSVVSTLRRIAGIQLDGSVNLPYRLLSPSRRYSPVRAETAESRGGIITDVDPEVVRKGVRNLMQQVAQIERERDDYKTQMHSMKKQLHEVSENQSKGDTKLNSVLKNIRNLQDEKSALEAKLAQKHAALQAQTEALHQKTTEAEQIREKVVAMELTLHNTSDEKHQYEDKLEKMKNNLARIEAEKRSLEEGLNRADSRATKLELQRVSMEGDIQRLQMMLQEKDIGIQKLQEKCDSQGRTIASLEERCVSLKSTIDQLNSTLERASLTESELRSEIQSLQRSLLEVTATSHSGTEKLKQLQKMLANTENEKRVCNERLDTTHQAITELRRQNQQLQDQIARLNTELANNEVLRSGLESQLRLAQWPQDSSGSSHREDEMLKQQLHTAQRERSELRGKVDSLGSKIRQLENEKHQLERQAAKASTSLRSKSYERPEKSDSYEIDSVSKRDGHLEQENRELRIKIRRLESELSEREAELLRLKSQRPADVHFDKSSELEQVRAAQLQAERLLDAREQSHRQQVLRLENQVRMLREQLNEEVKRRQLYIMRSSRAGQEMQQLRHALGESLRTVSQDPSLDAGLLEHETRKLDSQLSHSALSSLPPALGRSSTPHFSLRSPTPQPK